MSAGMRCLTYLRGLASQGITRVWLDDSAFDLAAAELVRLYRTPIEAPPFAMYVRHMLVVRRSWRAS